MVESEPRPDDEPRPEEDDDDAEIDDPLKRETIKFLVRRRTGVYRWMNGREYKRLQAKDPFAVAIGVEAATWRAAMAEEADEPDKDLLTTA